MSKIARQVSGFIALPIQLPVSKSFPIPVTHYLYLRPDEPKLPTAEASRSLFLVNIPITTTEQHLKDLFSIQLAAGRIERVDFRDPASPPSTTPLPDPTDPNASKKRKQPSSTAIEHELQNISLPSTTTRRLHTPDTHAIVIFIDRPSMESTLRAAKRATIPTAPPLIWGQGISDTTPPLGLARYKSDHALRYPGRRALLSSVDAYMTTYARLEEARGREQARKRQVPDEDGFVMVTRGARGGVVRKEDADGSGEKEKQKKRKGGAGDGFYRFQLRERRKEEQGRLVRRFEEDRKTVEEMRKKRRRVGVSS